MELGDSLRGERDELVLSETVTREGLSEERLSEENMEIAGMEAGSDEPKNPENPENEDMRENSDDWIENVDSKQSSEKKLKRLKKNKKQSGTSVKKEKKAGKGRLSKESKESKKSLITMLKNQKIVTMLQSSIKYKLIGAFLIPVLLIVILGVVSYNVSSSAIKKSFLDSAESTIVKTADYYELMFSNVIATSNDIVNNVELQRYYAGSYSNDSISEGTTFTSLKSTISSSIMSDNTLNAAYIIGSYGNGIFTSASRLLEKDEYENVKKSAEGTVIDQNKSGWFTKREYLDSMGVAQYGLSYGRQVVGTSMKSVGYMFLDISYNKILAPLKDIDLGVDSVISLIAPDGGELITSNYMDIEEGTTYFSDRDFYTSVKDTDEKSGNIYVNYNGKKQLLIHCTLDSDFMVVAMIPESEIIAQADSIKIASYTIVIIAIVIALLVGGLFALNISKVITTMMGHLSRAASGDLTVLMEISRKDEFSTLAKSTQGMIDNFKGLIEETKEVSETVDQSSMTVTEGSKQVLVEAKEIQAAIEEIERGVVQQAEDSEHCLRQMDDLSSKINIVSENSSKIEQIAEETSKKVSDGIEAIEELKKDASRTVDITHQVINEIEGLKESSKSIGSIINAINEIASQTNLLSLNASIEAARAGDAGRGFAVVASEIRKLADQSVNFANEIQKIVEGINSKTNDTVAIAMKAEDVVEVQGQTLDSTAQVFNDIHNQFNGLLGNLEAITIQITQIADAKTKTVDAISSISAISEETAASSEEVAETAKRQVVSMERLSEAAEDLEKNSDNLRNAIDIFKV